MKIGSFKMSGADYTIELNNKLCKDGSSAFTNSQQKIIVANEYEKIKLNYDVIQNNIVSCFIEMVTVYEMEYRKLVGSKEYIYPFSSMLCQAINSITSKEGQWDGDVKIGGTNYMIIVNNELAKEDGFHGRCDGITKIIYLCTNNNGDRRIIFLPYLFALKICKTQIKEQHIKYLKKSGCAK